MDIVTERSINTGGIRPEIKKPKAGGPRVLKYNLICIGKGIKVLWGIMKGYFLGVQYCVYSVLYSVLYRELSYGC